MRRAGEASERIRAALAALLFVACLWWRFHPAPGEIPPGLENLALHSDAVKYYLPMMARAAERLRAGELPLWNPEACSGQPLLASIQSGVFYPPNALFLVLEPARALAVVAFLHCLFAALCAGGLFRAWGAGPIAAAVGGGLFVHSCLLGQSYWAPALATLAWQPALLWQVESLTRGVKRGVWFAFSASVALQSLAGFPQYLLYGHLLLAALTALRLVPRLFRGAAEGRAALASAFALLAGLVLGTALAALQWFPTAELIGQGLRTDRLTPQAVHYLNFHDFPASIDVLRRALDPTPGLITIGLPSNGYVGAATLLLAALALRSRPRDPLVAGLLVSGALALLLSDGYLGPGAALYERFAALPLLGRLRSPERLRMIYFLALTALAALGFAQLERTPDSSAGGPRKVFAGFGVVALTFGLGLGGGGLAVLRSLPAFALIIALTQERLAPRWRRGACAALALCMAGDLIASTLPAGPLRAIPLERYAAFRHGSWRLPEVLLDSLRDRAGSQRIALPDYVPQVGLGPTAGLRRPDCYEPLVTGGWAALHRAIWRMPSVGITLLRIDPERFPSFYDLTSVRFIVQAPQRRRGALRAETLENPDALPRAYWIGSHAVATREAVIERIARGRAELHNRVWLETGTPALAPQPGPGPRAATFLRDDPERIEVEINAPAAGHLVLADTWYPGWSARVDGRAAEILRANGLQRAVALDAGRHRVEFVYAPSSLRRGAALSVLALLVLCAIAAVGRPRRRRPPPAGPAGGAA